MDFIYEFECGRRGGIRYPFTNYLQERNKFCLRNMTQSSIMLFVEQLYGRLTNITAYAVSAFVGTAENFGRNEHE